MPTGKCVCNAQVAAALRSELVLTSRVSASASSRCAAMRADVGQLPTRGAHLGGDVARPDPWLVMHRSRLSRRDLLSASVRAGVGAIGLSLVGCADSESVGDAPQPEAASSQTQEAQAQQQIDFGLPKSVVEAVGQADEAVEQEQPRELSGSETFDPHIWREHYHWRHIQSFPRQGGRPHPGGELRIDAPGVREWSPFTEPIEPVDDVGLGGPGHFLPLLYSQLVTTQVDDLTNPHRTNVAGDLAERWEWPDELTLVFHLEQGVSWPDREPTFGRSLTASDVQVAHDAFRETGRRQAQTYDAVLRTEADDDSRTFKFHLSRPAAELLNKMTSPWHVVAPRELVVDPTLIDWRNVSRGTGPYTLFLSAPGREWKLKRNPTYFGRDPASGAPLPFLDAIRSFDFVKGLGRPGQSDALSWQTSDWRSGDLHSIRLPDGMTEAAYAFDANPQTVMQVTPPRPSGGLHFWFRSVQSGPFADVRTRRALSMALDRDAFTREMFAGFATLDCRQNWAFFRSLEDPGEMREWPWDGNELGPVVAHNPSEAALLLRAAGYDRESPLVLNLDIPPAASPGGTALPIYDQTTATALAAEQWEQVLAGLVVVQRREQEWRVTVEGSSWTRFDRFPNDEAEIIFGPRNRVYDVDPDDLAYAELHSRARSNPSGIADPDIDVWSVAQREARNPFERADFLERIRVKTLGEAWRIFLVNPYHVRARAANVFNLVNTYYADSLELAPKQLERTWIAR